MQKEMRIPNHERETEEGGQGERGIVCETTKERGGEVERVEKLLILRSYSLAASESLLLLTSLSSNNPFPIPTLSPNPSPPSSSRFSFTPFSSLLSSLEYDPKLPSLQLDGIGKNEGRWWVGGEGLCCRVVAVFMQSRFELGQRKGVVGFTLKLYGDYHNIPPPVAFLIGKWLIHTEEKELATSFLVSYLQTQPHSTHTFNLERVLCCDILRHSGIEEVEKYLFPKQTIPEPEKEKILQLCKLSPPPTHNQTTTTTTESTSTTTPPKYNTTVATKGERRAERGTGMGIMELGERFGKWILEGLGKEGFSFVVPSSVLLVLFVVTYWVGKWLLRGGKGTQGKGVGEMIKNFLGVIVESFSFSGR